MNYTLHQLKVFITVAEQLSITKAAEVLHLTQPAVSIQLRNFQDQFPLALTEVLGKKLYLTDFGKEILETSKRIINEAEKINDSVNRYNGQISGTLKISVVSTGKYVMPYFLSEFLDQHPGVNLKMDVTNKAQVIESLDSNLVDFSLVSILPERMTLETIPLMQNKLYVVGSPPYIEKNPIKKIDDLARSQLIFRENGSGTRQTIERFTSFNNIVIQKSMELTSNEAVKQAVIAGLGYSIMPLIGIKNELELNSLQIIPLKGFPLTSQWQLVWQKNKRFSLAAQAYINYLQEKRSDIISSKFEWYEAHH